MNSPNSAVMSVLMGRVPQRDSQDKQSDLDREGKELPYAQ